MYLDNVLVATVDQFSGLSAVNKLLYESDQLPYGNHSLKIKALGTKNANTNGSTYIVIDVFEYSPDVCSTCRSSAEVESKLEKAPLALQLQPNPAARQVSISLEGFRGEPAVQVSMSDMSGSATCCS